MRKTVNINKKIRVVDLFSGAGGLTYGFTHKIYKKNIYRRNIFDIVFANEIDKNAAASFKENFPNIPLFECDIAKIDKIFLLNNNINFNNVDLIIGGPPCQSFSTIGKRKYDERAKLYIEYKRLLSIIRPKIFIFENVIGILSMNDDNNVKVIDNINKLFSGIQSTNGEIGYKLHTKIIDLKKYGVPQTRKRVFIVGVRRDLDID
ncbi:MAG: DNA (cytosine-5-)-methyltransferase [Candidatus Peribacteria bacterium]|jgi:DNA (cytosine-5)-methyltransferase 1|nr:DNA (cytosine-5-)-methyltransferase [Candidatus Peribacteria bacterium]